MLKALGAAAVLVCSGFWADSVWKQRSSKPSAETRIAIQDPLQSDAARRHRTGATNHWKVLILHRR